jgi:formylglycine-generating enzyme required for sulfatase activity
MTFKEMIRMFDNPATLGEALIEAAQLPFRGEHEILFQQKRQKYISGLTDYERPIWVGEMKNLLLLYESENTRRDDKAGTTNTVHNGKADIFISYAHEDELRVRSIVYELERLGLTVFWDRTIPVGKTWHRHIETALVESNCVVVIWSKFSIVSEWVIEEAEYAKGKKILVPLLIDTVQPPFGFKRIQAANLSGWNNDQSHPEFRKCLDAIRSIVPISGEMSGHIASVSPVIIPAVKQDAPPDFVHIRGGIFAMGSPETEVDRSSDETQHQVKVSDFYLCRYTVSVADFREFTEESGYRTDAEKSDGSYAWDGKEWNKRAGINWRYGVSGSERAASEQNQPVLHISWNDATAYCEWLTAKKGKRFRLPSEAEWEYACRAGTTTPFNTGQNLTTEQANYDGNYPYNENEKGRYRQTTVSVDSLKPNTWGLYNMHGNVWEWCNDWYGDKYYDECKINGVVVNPQGPETGSYRVIRGGSWDDGAQGCRSAYRDSYPPVNRSYFIGFRLVFVPQSVGSLS